MIVLLAAALAGTVAFAQSPAPQADRALKAPDCQTLVMTSPGPGVLQLCQGEAAMRRAEAAGAASAEGRKQLASAASELERAADALRDVDLKIYAVEALIRLYDDTHLKQPHGVEQALRSLIPLMPGSSSPLRRIATIQEAQGQIDAAENTLLGARQQVPDDVEVYRALSEFYGRRAAQTRRRPRTRARSVTATRPSRTCRTPSRSWRTPSRPRRRADRTPTGTTALAATSHNPGGRLPGSRRSVRAKPTPRA